MTPVDSELARVELRTRIATLRAYRGAELYREMTALLDTMLAHYQGQLTAASTERLGELRIAALQVEMLRTALTTDNEQRIALTL